MQYFFLLLSGLLILLSHVSVHLSSSQNSDIYHRHKRHTDTAVVGLHASLLLKSPGFPKCCQPFTFLIEFGGREGTGYIRLLFDDLDLPKSSSLQVRLQLIRAFFVCPILVRLISSHSMAICYRKHRFPTLEIPVRPRLDLDITCLE